MVTNNEIGELEIINLPGCTHLWLNLKILKKLMQYKLMWLASVHFVIFAPISDDILLQIHTNINKK
jgi:hypothetical protein